MDKEKVYEAVKRCTSESYTCELCPYYEHNRSAICSDLLLHDVKLLLRELLYGKT